MESFEEFKRNGDRTETASSVVDSMSASGIIDSSENKNAASTSDSGNVLDSLLIPPTSTARVESPNEEPPHTYPHLTQTLSDPNKTQQDHQRDDEEDDEEHINLTKSFQRAASPSPIAHHRNKVPTVSKVGEEGVRRMHKFTLYETANYYYVVGADLLDSAFRILKIDRTAEDGQLTITEDDIVYNRKETYSILNAIDEGNRATGGLKLKTAFWGILGFIQFTGPYHMIYVTKRSQVAIVGGHYVYQIDKTEIMTLQTAAQAKIKTDRHVSESRYLGILTNLDLSRSFYFSYSYDVTRTLQHNIMREREALQQGLSEPLKFDHNDMFVWNHHLLEPARQALRNPFDWCLSIIHGYVDQAGLSVYWGRMVYVTIIARRSRFFAGARFLKRGANDLGYVANDVETEQIVSEMLTTSFHAPGPRLFANPNYTSHVQHRGSIPLYWAQDNTGVSPKPDIQLNVVDPFFSAAALHFDDLFKRYSTPIYVLNLIKSRERTPRESKLLKEFTLAISYLNQFLPKDKQILYHAWDMSRASKSRDQDVIGSLEGIAEDILPRTGFFQNGNDAARGLRLQSGVARTNCIDCLDRTNAAQFVIAKKALGYQLQALGVIENTSVEYDSDAVNLFTHMWHDHGDTIAIQYGGSHLVNTMATYRKINQWTSHSRDMVESFKRFYNNSFMDAQRQEAYNLFLGNYVYNDGEPMLWDLSSDYYLHHANPRSMFGRRRPSYRQWYTEEYLEPPKIPPSIWPHELADAPLHVFDDYWVEYYRPLALTSFRKLFSFKMHSNLRYIPFNSSQGGKYDLSPFKVRTGNETGQNDNSDKKDDKSTQATRRKGVKIIAPSEESLVLGKDSSIDARLAASTHLKPEAVGTPSALGPLLESHQQYDKAKRHPGIIKDSRFLSPKAGSVAYTNTSHPTSRFSTNHSSFSQSSTMIPPGSITNYFSSNTPLSNSNITTPTKADLALQAFTALIATSLSPTVPETEEYTRYVAHPSNIPLVVSSQTDYSKAPAEFLDYIARTEVPGSSTQPTITMREYPATGLIGNGGGSKTTTTLDERANASYDDYADFLASGARDEPLTVMEADGALKRYKAYRQWLRGKSLFKQKF